MTHVRKFYIKKGINTMINQLQYDPTIGRQPYSAKNRKNFRKPKHAHKNIETNNQQPKIEDIQAKKIDSKPTVFEDFDEPLIDFNKPMPKSTGKKVRDAVLGSLMALATISLPTVAILDEPKGLDIDSSYLTEEVEPLPPFEGTYCNVEAVALGGENDTIVEPAEILQLLDYSRLSALPEDEQDEIMEKVSAQIKNVNVHDVDAQQTVINQVRSSQGAVNKAIANSPNRPSLQYSEAGKAEYARNYITGDELIDCLDFSELLKYQKDASVLKAGLREKMAKIKRNDEKALEKFDAERENAQRLINKIVHNYVMNSHVSGNANCDNAITVDEIFSKIDTSVIGHLPKYEQKRVIKSALGSFNTIVFPEIRTDEDIEKVNKRVDEEAQKIQDKLDRRAVPITYRWSMQ